jgi:hypothetical protein
MLWGFCQFVSSTTLSESDSLLIIVIRRSARNNLEHWQIQWGFSQFVSSTTSSESERELWLVALRFAPLSRSEFDWIDQSAAQQRCVHRHPTQCKKQSRVLVNPMGFLSDCFSDYVE